MLEFKGLTSKVFDLRITLLGLIFSRKAKQTETLKYSPQAFKTSNS